MYLLQNDSEGKSVILFVVPVSVQHPALSCSLFLILLLRFLPSVRDYFFHALSFPLHSFIWQHNYFLKFPTLQGNNVNLILDYILREKKNHTFPNPEISKIGLFFTRVRSRNSLEAAYNRFWVEHCLPIFFKIMHFHNSFMRCFMKIKLTQSHMYCTK